MNLFFERYLEWLLRQKKFDLTPDRIRYALAQVHTTIVEDKSTGREAKVQSMLSPDTEKIFQVLGISTERGTSLNAECCA